jgi:hypothetical protein
MIQVQKSRSSIIGAAIAAAALSLPFSGSALAESAPEKGVVSFRYLNYQDSQTNQDRISVNAYSIHGMAPIDEKWSVDVTATYDSVSGASPSFHNTFPAATPVVVTSASGGSSSSSISGEQRQALNMGLTHYFTRGTLTLGTSYSSESDYSSAGLSLQGSFYVSDNKNTMLTLGGSYTHDTIEPNYGGSSGGGDDEGEGIDDAIVSTTTSFTENKDIVAGLVGITQVMTKNDIIQVNFGYSHGTGFYSDPYKLNDSRPRKRDFKTMLVRWNHYIEPLGGAARFSYRYYTDTFGIDSQTFGIDYAQALPADITLTPSVRFYSQSTADFYIPADPSLLPSAPDVTTLAFSSFDQRLSAFGAVTLGLKVQKKFEDGWTVDIRFDRYMQRYDWGINGKGDPNIADFNASFIQLGVTTEF